MKSEPKKLRFLGFFYVWLLLLLSTTLNYAEPRQRASSSNIRRVNFSLSGGYAYSESQSGMVDVKAEVQFSVSSSIRAGLGVGYLSNFHMHMSENMGGMGGGMMEGVDGDFSEHNHDFKVIPITLSLYYVLPVNHKLDIFMVGGAGYYLSSFRDISSQEKNAFGSHAGFGFDLKIAERVLIVAEGIYRFVNLKGFTNELHSGFREGMEGEENEEGFWHYNHDYGEYHFHEFHEDQAQMMLDSPPFNISLNGFSLRAGIKFSF